MLVAMQSRANVTVRGEVAIEEAEGKHFSRSNDPMSQAVTILPQTLC